MGSNREVHKGSGLTWMELEQNAQLISMKSRKCLVEILTQETGKVPSEEGHKLIVSDLRRKGRNKKRKLSYNKHTKRYQYKTAIEETYR